MGKNSPFIKKFKTSQNKYIYDVNTNEFILVDDVVYDIIEDYGILTTQELTQKFSPLYPVESIKKALGEIDSAVKQGNLFSAYRPSSMKMEISKEELMSTTRSGLEQIILNVSEQCNLRCKYCVYSGLYYSERSHSPKMMSMETTRKAVDYLIEHSQNADKPSLTFYGGEPLVNIDAIRFAIDYSKKVKGDRDLQYGLTTNGTLLNDEIIRFFIDNKVTLTVSLDGPQHIHDRFRVDANGHGSWERVMSNLKKIKAMDSSYYKSRVMFNVVLSPPFDLAEVNRFFDENKELLTNIAPQISPVDAADTDFFKVFPVEDNLYAKTNQELKKEYEEELKKSNIAENSFLNGMFQPDLSKIHKRQIFAGLPEAIPMNGCCIPGKRKIFVSVDGGLHICERISSYFKIGDIEKGIDYERLNKIIQHYIEISREDCCNCWAVRFCSLCFATAKKEGSLDIESKRAECDYVRDNCLETMTLYNSTLENHPKAFDYLDKYVIV